MSQTHTTRTKLRLRTWPDKILRKKCTPVEVVDDEIRRLLDEMFLLMKVSGGVGLAANQAGLDICLVTIEAEDRIFKLVNPRIVRQQGSLTFTEGCLSFPELELEVQRAKKVWLSALNEKGEPLDLEVEGVLAVIFQHEVDHINGTTFVDKVPFWKRVTISSQLKNIARLHHGMHKQKAK